jgi:hypothetical protein
MGRRIRDLYRVYSSALGDPSDAITQSAILAASQLATAAEDARHALIVGESPRGGCTDEVVRLENLAARRLRSLGLGKPATARRQKPRAALAAMAQEAAE